MYSISPSPQKRKKPPKNKKRSEVNITLILLQSKKQLQMMIVDLGGWGGTWIIGGCTCGLRSLNLLVVGAGPEGERWGWDCRWRWVQRNIDIWLGRDMLSPDGDRLLQPSLCSECNQSVAEVPIFGSDLSCYVVQIPHVSDEKSEAQRC